jgi:hypothetical protein
VPFAVSITAVRPARPEVGIGLAPERASALQKAAARKPPSLLLHWLAFVLAPVTDTIHQRLAVEEHPTRAWVPP